MCKALSSSVIFNKTWLSHFSSTKNPSDFSFITGVSFIKNKYLPIYESIGGSLLMSSNRYNLAKNDDNKFNNKLAIIYNLPSYQQTPSDSFLLKNGLKLRCIKEYEAYLADFSQYENINNYFSKQVGSKKIGNIKRRKKRLEKCFNITYKLFYKANLSKNSYDMLMTDFKRLLINKFNSKKEFYPITDNHLWEFYNAVLFPMIENGEASLFVVYNNDIPISFYLCYHFEGLVTGVIPVFDMAYSKFGLGSITIMKLFEALYDLGIKTFDFYKGEYDYKNDWCNKNYTFEQHLIYNNSLISKSLAFVIANKLKFKQYLREKGVNNFYYKARYKLKYKSKEVKQILAPITITKNEFQELNLEPISVFRNHHSNILKHIYDYIYLKNIHIDNINVYKNKDKSNVFIYENIMENTYIKLS